MFREVQGHLYSTVLALRIGLFTFAFFDDYYYLSLNLVVAGSSYIYNIYLKKHLGSGQFLVMKNFNEALRLFFSNKISFENGNNGSKHKNTIFIHRIIF